ncbi:uncharacterized protein LOC130208251 isoform X4 [Pseudoliparis swirei]|uniref:uncharacterized protein LOC130208251 isoform X4 n=1 Tax=Pseudoliparis swirei TaxID=2059687 RepID=UPI0024BEB381|nr:uncharacterized protein LOC130208251 isoform X4 [Pseudoliparis swirei]
MLIGRDCPIFWRLWADRMTSNRRNRKNRPRSTQNTKLLHACAAPSSPTGSSAEQTDEEAQAPAEAPAREDPPPTEASSNEVFSEFPMAEEENAVSPGQFGTAQLEDPNLEQARQNLTVIEGNPAEGIVFLKPPWTLHDVLRCLKKHWIAVFGQVAPQRQLDNVLHLIDFFNSGQTATCDTTAAAVRQAKELINVFRERSRLVPGAVSTMENIDNALRPPPPCEAPARDVDMNDTEEEEPRRPPTRRCGPCLRPRGPACLRGALRCSEFWALTTTPRRGRWGGGSSAAAVCLHELRSVVAQLLRAFSSSLTWTPD